MTWLLVSALVVAAVLIALRWLLVHRLQAPSTFEPFAGAVYRVGEATVLERGGRDPRVTVVCMHGFLENFDYFTQYYADPSLQLVLIASAGYHAPEPTATAEWA